MNTFRIITIAVVIFSVAIIVRGEDCPDETPEGEETPIPGECGVVICTKDLGDGTISRTRKGCAKPFMKAGCTITQDKEEPYPNCCPITSCPETIKKTSG